jgi:hypothetical protein
VSLLVLQSLWAMEGQRPPGYPAVLEGQVEAIAAAGFDGVLAPTADLAVARAACDAATEHGLAIALGCLPRSPAELAPVLELAVELGPGRVDHVNLQPNRRPATVAESVGPLREWSAEAADVGVALYFETHRGRMTNDLIFTLDLLAAVPELELTADLSHYVVAREMGLPLLPEDSTRMDAILARSRAFHGRVAAPGQIQAQIEFAQHQPWLERFEAWWETGLRQLAARLGPGDSIPFTVELGPPPAYAATGAEGRELSDRWQESISLMLTIRRIWAQVVGDPAVFGQGG